MLWTRPCETRRLSLQSGSTPQRWSGSGEPFSKGHPACTGRGFGRYTSSSDGATATASSAEETSEGAGQSPDHRGQPPKPSIPNTARRRAVVATIIGRRSNGTPFNGTRFRAALLECRRCVCDQRQQTHHQPIMDRARRRRGKNSGHDRRDPMKRESKSSDPDAPYGLMEPLVLRRIQRVREGD